MENHEQTITFPEWWYRNKRPSNDDSYFRNLCRVIFQTGLNWHVVEKKWPTIMKAFFDFNVDKVAIFSDNDIQRLLNDRGVIRNREKIHSIIENAKLFKNITRNMVHSKHI